MTVLEFPNKFSDRGSGRDFSTLPTRTSTFIRGDHTFPWECDDEDGDHRFYELAYGAKAYLNFNLKSYYPNGDIHCEGTYIDGYKAGIWRFFDENGLLSQVGSYNRGNERFGKWRFYEKLDGKAVLKMMMDDRGSYERYWSYDMDGKLWLITKWLNTKADLEDQIAVEEFYEPNYRKWPQTY